jgi:hypothetical protein
MDKRMEGLAGAMREIAEQRDNQLRASGAICGHRLEQLRAFLATELPVEAALFAAARQRDKSLSLPEPALPAAVHAALVEHLRSVRAKAKPFDALRDLAAWCKAPRWLEAYRTAAIAALAIVVTSAVLHFSRSREHAATQIFGALPRSVANPESPGFSSDEAHLSLRVTRFELASLDPSLLSLNRALPNLEQSDRGLPLDLPIRQIRLDVEAVRTP